MIDLFPTANFINMSHKEFQNIFDLDRYFTLFLIHLLQKLARPMEMVFSTPKRFELRDLPPSGASRSYQEAPTRGSDSETGMIGLNNSIGLNNGMGPNNGMVSPAHNLSVNERIRREVVGLPPRYPPSTSSMTSSVMSTPSVLSPDTGDEEKLARWVANLPTNNPIFWAKLKVLIVSTYRELSFSSADKNNQNNSTRYCYQSRLSNVGISFVQENDLSILGIPEPQRRCTQL